MDQSAEEQFGLSTIVANVRRERIEKILKQPGVHFSCYAKFTCPTCKNQWDSYHAFAYMGQMCDICCDPNDPDPVPKKLSVQPTDLEPLYYFHCKSKSNNGGICNALWRSLKEPETQECKLCSAMVKCGEVIRPLGYVYSKSSNPKPRNSKTRNQDEGDEDEEDADFRANHKIRLCEMCRYMRLYGPLPQRNMYKACYHWPKELRVKAIPEAIKLAAQLREQQHQN